jgi:hypothetical protein
VPAIFAWFVSPLIRRTSRQTLAHLLEATRRGLLSLDTGPAQSAPPPRRRDTPRRFAITTRLLLA